MAMQSQAALAEIRDSLVETYASNDAMNQLILSELDPRAWRAKPPGEKGGDGFLGLRSAPPGGIPRRASSPPWRAVRRKF